MILSGLRVIDAGSFIAGPAAATVLGDFGAEVIKIEPPEGDPYRGLHHAPGNPISDHDYCWIVDSRNKKSIALDLKQESARKVLVDLVKTADVFLTNMPMKARERLGMRWEDLEPVNDRLIYASLTAYGETGAEAGKTGFDSTAWWARAGLMDNVRSGPEDAPGRSLPGMGDHATAMSLVAAIMMGLYQREKTGKGGKVATSLMANGIWSNAILAQAMLCGAPFTPRPPRERALNALNNLYRCADDRWFMLVMLSEDRQWSGFTRALERPDLEHDVRFATSAARRAHSAELVAELDGVFRTRDWAEWRKRLDAEGITFGGIAKLEDIPTDRQMRDSGVVVPLSDPEAGTGLTVASPVVMSNVEKVAAGPAPHVGQHTDEILRSCGMSEDEIAELRRAGAAC